jgi:hypothetical protein
MKDLTDEQFKQWLTKRKADQAARHAYWSGAEYADARSLQAAATEQARIDRADRKGQRRGPYGHRAA